MKQGFLNDRSKRLRVLVPWALSLFACADHVPEVDDPETSFLPATAQIADTTDEPARPANADRLVVDGSRLKAIYEVAPGGMRFRGLHDTKLDVDCAWALIPGETDAVHCVPEKVVEVMYQDQACTKPSAPSVENARFDGVLVSGGEWVSGETSAARCGLHPLPTREGYRVGDQVTGPRGVGYYLTDGKCSINRNLGRGRRWLIPQTEGTFVRGKLVAGELAGQPSRRVVGDDGSETTIAVSFPGAWTLVPSGGSCSESAEGT